MSRSTAPVAKATRYYRQLADFMSFLIEDGLLDESDLGDNYIVVTNLLSSIAAADPGLPTPPGHIIGEHGYEPCTECGEPADNGEGWDGLCGNCADARDGAS